MLDYNKKLEVQQIITFLYILLHSMFFIALFWTHFHKFSTYLFIGIHLLTLFTFSRMFSYSFLFFFQYIFGLFLTLLSFFHWLCLQFIQYCCIFCFEYFLEVFGNCCISYCLCQDLKCVLIEIITNIRRFQTISVRLK